MQDETKRLITFVILSALILFGFNLWYMPKYKKINTTNKNISTPSPQITKALKKSTIKNKVSTTIKEHSFSTTKLPLEKTYTLENELIKVTFSNIGGVINSFIVKNYHDEDTSKKENPVELIPNKSSYTYMKLYSPLFQENKFLWKMEKKEDFNDYKKIIFSYNITKGIKIIKEYTIKNNSYLININFKFINSTKKPYALKNLSLLWGPNIRFLPEEMKKHKKGRMYQYNKVVCKFENNKIKRYNINLHPKENKLTIIDDKLLWVAYKDNYFMSSFIFKDYSFIKNIFIKEEKGGYAYLGINFNDFIINPEETKEIVLPSFIGPQEYNALKKLNMQDVVNLGWRWLRPFSIAMFYSMDFLYKITKNYGIAIILLTIIIRLLLWIPSQRSYKHMKETQQKMKIIQPRLETLKKVYKNDPQKLNEETMKLYREYKINPFGGCLPMLLQFPIFIALYQTLINMVELKGAYFFGWLKDLSQPDPLYILPVFMGVTMVIQQKMSQTPSPTQEAETQQKIFMYGLPVFLTFLAFSWPSGLLLYWSMSNILSIVQQIFVNKSK